MTVTESSEKLWRRVMLAWSFFMGFGAILGGGMGMLSPLGEWYGGQAMVPNLQKLPFADIFFQNLFVPSLGLFVLVGVFNLTAGILVLKHKPLGVKWACINGLIISAFTAMEVWVLGVNPLSVVFCIMGFVQFACGLHYTQLNASALEQV